jgi:hypothetical protein
MPWDLTGNSGTNPDTDFLGTTDDQPLVIKTNGAEALRIDGSGRAGIGGFVWDSPLSCTEFGQGPSTLLFLRRDESQEAEGEFLSPAQNVTFILDPTNRVFNLDVGGQDNSRARIHLGDRTGPDNRVTTLGSVGIGTTNPQEKLEVSGNILARGDLRIFDSQGRQVFHFDSNHALLDIGATGADGGAEGDLRIFDSQGRQVFHFDSNHAVLDLGATDSEGDLRIRGDDGQFKIHLDGGEGDIKLLGADCAEDFDVSEVEAAEPGTVMVIDQEGTLKPSERPYDKRVAGVVSGAGGLKPGIVLDKQEPNEGRLPVALVGKVVCNVDARHSPIEVGDLLTTSSTPGHAMKANDALRAFGAVLGKALRPLEQGQGIVPILVALQ